jgi:hypothetical protein
MALAIWASIVLTQCPKPVSSGAAPCPQTAEPDRARFDTGGFIEVPPGDVRAVSLVRMIGLEPTLPRGNRNLNPARLPISPHPQTYDTFEFTTFGGKATVVVTVVVLDCLARIWPRPAGRADW